MTQSALINVIFKASEKAARGLVRDFGEVENLQISRKGVADFVSNADMDAEKTIRFELAKARPGWGFIMEESGEIAAEEEDAPTWIVDPLDGTTNYIHGIPHFCISIAATDKPLNKGGKVVAAGIFDPMRNEFFFAEQGKGLFSMTAASGYQAGAIWRTVCLPQVRRFSAAAQQKTMICSG